MNISKFYRIDFSKIKICRPTGIHIGAQRHRRNVACTELLLSQYLLKSHVKIILNIIRISKTQIASLSGHLPSYLIIFLTNFWLYHFFSKFWCFSWFRKLPMHSNSCFFIPWWSRNHPRLILDWFGKNHFSWKFSPNMSQK